MSSICKRKHRPLAAKARKATRLARELDLLMVDNRRLTLKAEARGDYKTADSLLKSRMAIIQARAEKAARRSRLDLVTKLRKIAEFYNLDPDIVLGPLRLTAEPAPPRSRNATA